MRTRPARRLWARAQQTSAWSAWRRYSTNRGNLLAGGVAFNAFFSVFPIVAIAFSVFGVLLQNRPDWLDAIREAVNAQLPGFVQDPATGEGIIPVSVPASGTLAGVASVGTVLMLYAGLGWLTALRNGIREIFGVAGSPGNFVVAKLRDLGVLVVIGLGIAVSAGISAVAGGATQAVANLVGVESRGWLVGGIGFLVGFLFDAALVGLVLRILSGVDLPWSAVRSGALFGGAGLTLLKMFGSRLIAGTLSNPLFASFALVVGLLVWLNFMSRVVLVAAAWAANDLEGRFAVQDTAPQWRPLAEPSAVPDGDAAGPPGTVGTVGTGTGGLPVGAVTGLPAAWSLPPEETPAPGPGVGGPAGGPTRRGTDRAALAAGALAGACAGLVLGLGWRRSPGSRR